MFKLTVKRERVGPVLGRHPWVFSGALLNIPNGLTSGEPVWLADEAENFLAAGYFNSYSQIAVRIWGWEKEEVNQEFFLKRIKQAYNLRKTLVENKDTNAFRVVNAENDLLPGLIVDKYADYLCVQFHTLGMERWRKEIVAALIKIIKPKGIYERSDVLARKYDDKTTGVEARPVGLLHGEVPEKVKILENGYKFWVDIIGGQKTGFFLDQRDKRLALKKYAGGKKVLNCFSYTGGFSVYALAAGAKKVVSVDSSESALLLAEENVKLNKLDVKKCEFILADVKEYLWDLANTPPAPLHRGDLEIPSSKEGGRLSDREVFDVIILDPPAFIKDRHKIQEGIMGYQKINEMALRLLPAGGILVTASCSQHLSLVDFRFMLTKAAGRAGRTLQIIETYTHGIDHPELVAFNEGEYLKCIFALVS